MAQESGKGKFRLEIPVDAAGVEGRAQESAVKVAILHRDGSVVDQVVRLNAEGHGTATFEFPDDPGNITVIVGPRDALTEDLLHLQTIRLQVNRASWQGREQLHLQSIVISPYYWYWWLHWCRTYTVRGRVVCPDGSPVPGATVCAFDVDWWWWWVSKSQVGCATTDATGSFQIRFRVCCGWWPWWWWLQRAWQLDLTLAERIVPVLQAGLPTATVRTPTATPSLALFEELLAGQSGPTRRPADNIDPAALEGLRTRLLSRLPAAPELERLRIWPWWPWWPWWDCDADIIFQVKQECGGQTNVIVDEGFLDTRWDIPANLTVTLVANDRACCITHEPPPQGNCLVITEACDVIDNIGGNPGAPALPVGYANPGWVAPLGDRPFAGTVPLSGQFGDMAHVDYYEFEWATSPGGPWNAMLPGAAGGFTRQFFGPGLPAGPTTFYPAPFGFTTISGRNVIESREHFEANNGPGSWGVTRFWTAGTAFLLMNWLTEATFSDGTYYLRVRAWNLVGGNLVDPRILPLCDTEKDNGMVLTVDNRIVGPASGHPLGPPHPCGSGTVHTCTTEPDTDFLSVRINGAPAGPCSTINAEAGGTLDIDFLAHDPDGHLGYYTLYAKYGVNQAIDLLAVAGATLTPGAPAGAVSAAAQVGPTYASALAQSAVAPIWRGGTIRLHIPDLRQAFPVTCCYQLELWAYKRTIVSCSSFPMHNNVSEFSLTVML